VILWLTLPGPGHQPKRLVFWIKFFLESRLSSGSLDPLIDFVIYLEPKLWSKNQQLIKILLPQTVTLGILYPWPLLAVSRQQNELESCSNPLTEYLVVWKIICLLLDVRFFIDVYITRGCLCIFLHLDDVNIQWELANRADFVAQSFFGFVCILGYNTSSAGLTIAANVAIATGPAVFCNKSYLLHCI